MFNIFIDLCDRGFMLLFKIIFHCLCYYSCPSYPPLSPFTQTPPPSQYPHHCPCPWVLHKCSWLLHVLYCTLHPYGYSVTTVTYFLIPSTFFKNIFIDYAITVVPFPPILFTPSCPSPPSHIPPL